MGLEDSASGKGGARRTDRLDRHIQALHGKDLRGPAKSAMMRIRPRYAMLKVNA